MTRYLNPLPPCQVLVDGNAQFIDPLLQVTDRFLQVLARLFIANGSHLLQLALEIEKGLLKIQQMGIRRGRHADDGLVKGPGVSVHLGLALSVDSGAESSQNDGYIERRALVGKIMPRRPQDIVVLQLIRG